MSRTPFAPLFDRIVDDAAVFPPGLAPVEVAVREHLDRRVGPYAAYIGPLLVPATAAGELADHAARDDRAAREPIEVGLVVRPDSPIDPLLDAVELLRDEPCVLVTQAEVGWSIGWRRALETDLPVVVEVGVGSTRDAALDDIAAAVDDDREVVAKFRTGETPAWPWPDERVLGAFLDDVILRGLPFKLTGGLHHAVRGEYSGKPMHGLLNVLLATQHGLDGAEAPELAGILGRRDAEILASAASAVHADQAVRVRRSFTAYGCCGVLDPLTELEALGLLTPGGTA
jgi:hypothetical protein